MQPYSGSVVEYDEDTKTCRRIYLDMFLNHEIFEDTAFEIEDLKEFLEEEFQKIKRNIKCIKIHGFVVYLLYCFVERFIKVFIVP